jgi:2-haloacid dehalogenase
MAVEAVIFDIGNVLIEWNPERVYDARIGEARRKALFAEVPLHAINDAVDRGAHWQDTIEAAAQAHPNWAAEIRLWVEAWDEMAQPRIPRSIALLRALRARGVPVHALTNFGVETFAHARKTYEFLDEFDVAFVSGHLRLSKPDPAIYAVVEDRLGLPADRLLFTDDRAENIAVADGRGWRTHLFDAPEGWARRLVAEGLLGQGEAGL